MFHQLINGINFEQYFYFHILTLSTPIPYDLNAMPQQVEYDENKIEKKKEQKRRNFNSFI